MSDVWVPGAGGTIHALLAVPVSGALQVVVTAVRQERNREQLVLPDNFADAEVAADTAAS